MCWSTFHSLAAALQLLRRLAICAGLLCLGAAAYGCPVRCTYDLLLLYLARMRSCQQPQALLPKAALHVAPILPHILPTWHGTRLCCCQQQQNIEHICMYLVNQLPHGLFCNVS